MDNSDDAALMSMASELRAVLKSRGLDPKDPPPGMPPTDRIFAEYQSRGGTAHTDAEIMTRSLITEVAFGNE